MAGASMSSTPQPVALIDTTWKQLRRRLASVIMLRTGLAGGSRQRPGGGWVFIGKTVIGGGRRPIRRP
ncbi:hypothetical protein B1987_13540 [Mycobacterium kansasii]|nr:hypothetical protein B1987_13540 [Mycobacterium kansasii]